MKYVGWFMPIVRLPNLISILFSIEYRLVGFANHAQMCIFERVRIFQAIAKYTVEAGVTEQERACKHQHGDGKQVAQNIKRQRKPFVVDQVIGPGTEAWIPQIAEHAQVGSQKQKRVPSPPVIQSGKKKK